MSVKLVYYKIPEGTKEVYLPSDKLCRSQYFAGMIESCQGCQEVIFPLRYGDLATTYINFINGNNDDIKKTFGDSCSWSLRHIYIQLSDSFNYTNFYLMMLSLIFWVNVCLKRGLKIMMLWNTFILILRMIFIPITLYFLFPKNIIPI